MLRDVVKFRAPTPMNTRLATERAAARQAFNDGDDGWRHLERAHVLSQPWAWDHVRVHAAMLRRAWHERDRTEVRGQVLRLIVAGPGSLANRYPVGNNGRARVSATAPMPITEGDLRAALIAVGQPVGEN